MSYQEKKTIATLTAGLLVLGTYCAYAIPRYRSGVTDLSFWALTMLVFIGAGIVLTIVILIVFHVINEVVREATRGERDELTEEDEMDRLVNLKSMRNSFVVVGAGFVLSLALLALKQPAVLALNVVFLSFLAGSLFEGLSQLYFYRRGV